MGECPTVQKPKEQDMSRVPTGFLLAGALLTGAATATAGSVREWQVPWPDTRPRDPWVAPDGKVWFCGQKGGYLASFNPESGEFKRFELDKGEGPHNLIIDAQGAIWYAGNLTGHIGRMDPATGAITKYPMPDARAVDPHTLIWDGNGDIWFTVQGGNFVGRLATRSGKVDLVEVPTPGARPYGIVVDGANRPWIVLFGSHKLATVDPATLKLTEIPLPREDARPRRLALTSDGAVWYVDYNEGMLGRYSPADGSFREWPLPDGAKSRPYGMAVDDRDRLWIAESGTNPNRLVGFDAAKGQFLPGADVDAGTIRHMYFHPQTRAIWFGTDTNFLARFQVP
jgi:virginiamycin B lyase